MERITCKHCGRDTNEAPRPEWVGYCPTCVTVLFLDDMTTEQKIDMLAEALAHRGAIIEVVIVSDDDNDHDQTKMKVVGKHGDKVQCETTICLN